MEFLSSILGKLFSFIYESLKGMGIGNGSFSTYAMTIIAMGVIYKILTIPMTLQTAKQQRKQKEMQPELDRIKQKYGYDQQIYQKKMMEFQKENNMMQGCGGSCLTFIFQMVIIFALYNVIKEPQKYLHDYENINRAFFWIKDLALADPTGFALPLINSVSQLGYQFLNKSSMDANPQAGSMQTMMYVMPIMFFFIFRNLPAALVLYWSVGNVLEILIRGFVFLIRKARGND